MQRQELNRSPRYPPSLKKLNSSAGVSMESLRRFGRFLGFDPK